MKKLLFVILTTVTLNSFAGSFSLGIGAGREDIDTKTALGHVVADLYQVAGSYRSDSGIIVGTSVMLGYPNKTWASNEGRYEVFTGYSTKVNNFLPYALVAYGTRTRDNLASINYYTVTLGSKYMINQKWFTDTSYRFRDTNDMKWKTDTYSLGLGYNLSSTIAIQTSYGKTSGDYISDQYSVFITNKF